MHPFKSLFLIHLHVSSLSLSLSLANCPSTIFQSTNFLFILLQFFFNSLRSIVSLYALVLFVLTATGIGSILFLTYQPRLFTSLFRLFSHSISHLPSFFLETYNYALSFPGDNSLFIVIYFLVFLYISCSLLFHLSIPAPHLIMETVKVFSTIILFLPFSLIFKINFALLKSHS